MGKTIFNSKTIIFFVLSIIAIVTMNIVEGQGPDTFNWSAVDWKAIIVALGGIFLRFFTSKPVEW